MKKKTEKRTRLSMKLLWKMYAEFIEKEPKNETVIFLDYVEKQMKPLKP